MTKKVWTTHASGIKSKIRKRDGKRIFYAEVWHEGKRCTEKAGTTERQAVKKLATMQAAVDNGTYLPPAVRKVAERREAEARPTFAVFGSRYFDERKHEWKRVAWHRDRIRGLTELLGDLKLEALTRATITARLGSTKATPMYNRHLIYLRTMLRYAVEAGLLPHDPSEGIRKAFTEDTVEREPLTHAEAEAIVQHADRELAPAIRFALATGLRWGEVATLEWRDIDRKTRVASITRSKTKSSNRKVPLSTTALEALLGVPKGEGEALVFTMRGAPLIAYSEKGRRTCRHERPWRKACKAAGIKTFPHITRHTWATNYLANGGDLFTLSRIGGWSDLKMLQQRYGHLERDWIDRALAPMERQSGTRCGTRLVAVEGVRADGER